MKKQGRKFWTGQVAELERSGEPLESAAARQGVLAVTLRVWRNRLRREAVAAAPRMVAVRVAPPPAAPPKGGGSSAELEVVLPDGMQLRFGAGAESSYVVAVLRGLRASSC